MGIFHQWQCHLQEKKIWGRIEGDQGKGGDRKKRKAEEKGCIASKNKKGNRRKED